MSGPSPNGKVFPLSPEQLLAVDPRDTVWLSASAGTGKTQVLSARVLRLLLRPDVRPEQILCLTFTKAGAAEMATRVNAVLASWVRMGDAELAGDVLKIGGDNDAATVARARTLFAQVLDCPGGGLRIDTIHAFAQWLLAAFPSEAGLEPGTRPMEDRDRDLLAHQVLSDLLVDWCEQGDTAAISAIEVLSIRMGPDATQKWLMRCAQMRDVWLGPQGWQPPMRPRAERLLGIGEGESRADVENWCSDEVFDLGPLRQIADAYHSWGTPTAAKFTAAIAAWLNLPADQRLAGISAFRDELFTKESTKDGVTKLPALKWQANILKNDPDIGTVGDDLLESLNAILDRKAVFDLVDLLVPALELGRRYALAWDEAKRREGLIDFDDLIRKAADLLETQGLGEWIRYKLDRQFDHVLIDEAQDTNQAQWSIVDALTDDFFTGLGQHDDKLRTLFVVGDYKQAIFRFQGTSPENFDAAKNAYRTKLSVRAQNAITSRSNVAARELVELPLGRSYRTAQQVLTFVDDAIAAITPEALGLKERAELHVGDSRRPGLVCLWQPVPAKPEDEEETDAGPKDEDDASTGPETWISAPERRMADRIAAQIKHWMDNGFPLVKGTARNAGPGDVMVLVRKRKELAGLIVARLHAARVPVAGVDRLRLGAPLAVKDLLAALRFANQPDDSLSLAALLVSPIFGWSQQDLLDHGYRPKGTSLWSQLRDSPHPDALAAVAQLRDLLARADFDPPQVLLHWMLIGPWQARRKLTARLGSEANDPIDELLNAALAYSAAHVPSLQGFIRWFDAGEGELKRDAGEGGSQVRVMTVHGSKGLQAPIVILADATGDPSKSPVRDLVLPEEVPGGGGQAIPLPPLSKDQKPERVKEAEDKAKAEEMEEHWRLLYVAMTRAEEALFIGGALGKKETEPKPDSWYARLAPLFPGPPLADDIWVGRSEIGEHAEPIFPADIAPPPVVELPQWALTPIGPEPRPPRPLAPSAAGEEQGSDPPLPPDVIAKAARRGVLMHSLIERLPDLTPDQRSDKGSAWLARMAAEFSDGERADMLSRAMAVIAAPEWADLFGPGAMAEVPLAATVDGQVIAGTADRLLVEESRVLVADFKTARRPPTSLAEVPESTLRQMGAYAAALGVIFPGRTVEAVLLYTQTPQLIAIPAEILSAHKPRLAGVE